MGDAETQRPLRPDKAHCKPRKPVKYTRYYYSAEKKILQLASQAITRRIKTLAVVRGHLIQRVQLSVKSAC